MSLASARNADPLTDPTAVALRYGPRAGLLPELSRQTYDAFYKALREAILNGLDAGAERVELDFSESLDGSRLRIRDDGHGMSLTQFRSSFMALGGSDKYARGDRFGRIGIGSLAVLHYASETVIRTKPAGSDSVTIAFLKDAWDLDQAGRATSIEDFDAGYARETPYEGNPEDHFTEIELRDVRGAAAKEIGEAGAFFRLVDRLRRVLPLRWDDGPLLQAIQEQDLSVAAAIAEHLESASGRVTVRSPWGDTIDLTHRAYGDDRVPGEAWAGPPAPFLHRVAIRGSGRRRWITLTGYLLNQERAAPAWSGLTARVQNVAVEERTFFDLEADPGFRKYITGEVFIAGDVDTARLINIDRASFNREAADYVAIQRFMTQAITSFKASRVQQPQRAKVQVRRVIEDRRATVHSIAAVLQAAESLAAKAGLKRLPSSQNGQLTILRERDLRQELDGTGARITSSADGQITVAHDGGIEVGLSEDLLSPSLDFLEGAYRLRLVDARATQPPVVIRNRPREILVNLQNPHVTPRHAEVAVALEVAYVLTGHRSSTDLYDALLPLLSARAS